MPVAELVGGAFLTSFLNVLFERMASRPILDFFSRKKHNNELLMTELRMKLLTANDLVDDAEEKQMTSPTVKKWLDKLKHALYNTVDLLDAINTEALRRKLEGEGRDDDHSGTISSSSSTSQRQNHSSTCSWDEFDKTLQDKIVHILGVLRHILNEKDVLGLNLKQVVEDRSQERTRQTTSRVDESDVYGREKDRETIGCLLRSGVAAGHKIDVLPIVGMGGIGKTTLAQLAYNDAKNYFDVHAWVCVGEKLDILRIAQTIYGRVTKETRVITDLEDLSGKLEEALRNKKFLFVLDDVWCEDYCDWTDFMAHCKQYGVHGSKIVVTTRHERVASMMGGTLPTHHLREISEDESWLLFAKHAFMDAGVGGSQPNLEDIGRKIVTKCKGLPIAAKSIGGLLRGVLNPKEWEKVLKSDIWELPNNKILPALWLSYHYLPAQLKHCFAYCSIFPKDYKFTKPQLILLWMAEDLLHHKSKETVEEFGNDCFDILLSRSFFRQSSDTDMFGESLFTMHDLINDLAKFVSGDFCVRLEDHQQSLTSIISRTRHVSYMKTSGHGREKFVSLSEAKYLHTFLSLRSESYFFHGSLMEVLRDLLPTLKSLRVLDLSSYDMGELSSSIGNLKHLRHLDLSHTSIKQLPEAVCTLYNLQTLLLYGCGHLVELPIKLGRLINLRHLDISRTSIGKMPPDMGDLKDLQTLSDFVVDEQTGHQSIVELKELQHLHKGLTISGLGNIVHQDGGGALEENVMSDKKYLDKLVLVWGGDNHNIAGPENDREVLNKLKPHTNLTELMIWSYRDISFPVWLGDPSFSNLSSITLGCCKHCCILPPLGQLPYLRELEIHGLKKVVEIGEEFYYGNDSRSCGLIKPFRSLEKLTFVDMGGLQEWSYSYVGANEEEGGIFPNLCQLRLFHCPKLTGILQLVGSKCPKFHSLTLLEMRNCPNVVRFPDGGMDAPKLKHMYIRQCDKLRSLPEQMHTLVPSLEKLEICHCPDLESFPQGGLPPNLELLLLYGCSKLVANRAHWGLTRLNSLRRLRIRFIEQVEDCYAFPEEGLLPTTLTHLEICGLPNVTTIQGKELRQLGSLEYLSIQNCPELHCFSEEAPNFKALKELHIWFCPKLQCLPREWLPTSLSLLRIEGCPLLRQRFQKETGEDWPMIAHIPNIQVDGLEIETGDHALSFFF